MPGEELVTLADIESAGRRLDGVAVPTPLDHSRALSQLAGLEVLVKEENLQRFAGLTTASPAWTTRSAASE